MKLISSGPSTYGSAPASTTTSSESGDDDGTQNDSGYSHSKLTITARGTDAQGEQVNLTESKSLDDSGTDSGSDDVTVTAGGTNTDVIQDQLNAGAQVTDVVTGTVSTINSATGVTTTTTYDDLNVASSTDAASDADTATLLSGGGSTDAPSSSDNFLETTLWNILETTTQKNPDGTQAAAPSTNSVSGNDTQSRVNGVTTDLGATSCVGQALA